MEVRPRVASGVLLHVHAAEGNFTMYIHQGEVRVWQTHPESYTRSGQVMLLLFNKYGYFVGVFFQVVVLVKDGSREFFTKVSPRQGLCDGNWHRITGENMQMNTETLIKRNS